MNRPAYDEARNRLTRLEQGSNAPPVADALLVLSRAVLAVAEAINRSSKENR